MLDLKNAGLTELLHDFYTLTGLKLCIFDTSVLHGLSRATPPICRPAAARESPCSTDVTRG